MRVTLHTDDLHKLIANTVKAHNVAESKDIRRTMDDTSCEAKIIEDECADIREQLRKQEEHIEELRRKQAEYERIASSLRNGIFWTNSNSWFRGSWLFGSESPVLGSLAAPLIMVAGSLVLSSDYWTSRSTLSEMELLQAERESKARELASKTERLERVLQELSSERNSIVRTIPNSRYNDRMFHTHLLKPRTARSPSSCEVVFTAYDSPARASTVFYGLYPSHFARRREDSVGGPDRV